MTTISPSLRSKESTSSKSECINCQRWRSCSFLTIVIFTNSKMLSEITDICDLESQQEADGDIFSTTTKLSWNKHGSFPPTRCEGYCSFFMCFNFRFNHLHIVLGTDHVYVCWSISSHMYVSFIFWCLFTGWNSHVIYAISTLCWSHKTGLTYHQVDNILHARLSSSHILSVVICHNLVILLCMNLSTQAVPQRPPMNRQGSCKAAAQPPYGWQRDVEQQG